MLDFVTLSLSLLVHIKPSVFILFIYFFLFSSVFICVFYAEKMREAFAQQKLLLFFQQKKEMFLHAI